MSGERSIEHREIQLAADSLQQAERNQRSEVRGQTTDDKDNCGCEMWDLRCEMGIRKGVSVQVSGENKDLSQFLSSGFWILDSASSILWLSRLESRSHSNKN